jgi:hypothetical protein
MPNSGAKRLTKNNLCLSSQGTDKHGALTGFLVLRYKEIKLHVNVSSPETPSNIHSTVKVVRNVMTHAQSLDLVFQFKGPVHSNRRGCQFSRLVEGFVLTSSG